MGRRMCKRTGRRTERNVNRRTDRIIGMGQAGEVDSLSSIELYKSSTKLLEFRVHSTLKIECF